jgi:hypothetical protein
MILAHAAQGKNIKSAMAIRRLFGVRQLVGALVFVPKR